MKNVLRRASLIAALLAFPAAAQVDYLDHQHMDFRIEYQPELADSNQLDIVLGYDSGTNHFQAGNQSLYIVGGSAAKLTIPANSDYAFLGAFGAPIWVLPQTQNLSLPYVGTSGEDLPDGTFDGPVTFELRSVEGPGDFFVWQVSGAGQPPIVKMICTNGTVNSQYNSTAPLIGSHEHFNWAFSTNGLYRVTFRCTGRLLGATTNIVGKEVAWAFEILPLRPWEQWVSTNWPPATATNIAGRNADPDGDGMPNLCEYAFGTDPNNAASQTRPTAILLNAQGGVFGALAFQRSKAATDVTYSMFQNSGFAPNGWLPFAGSPSITDLGLTEQVVILDSSPITSAPQKFYRLQLGLNYP